MIDSSFLYFQEVTCHQGQEVATMRRQVWTIWMAVALAMLALILIGFRGSAPSTSAPSIGQDDQLAKAVWNVLRGVPALSGNDTLKVNVKNAVVKLEGVVERSLQKEAAEKAVASVPGVATVINLIEVHSNAPAGNISEKVRERMRQEGVKGQP